MKKLFLLIGLAVFPGLAAPAATPLTESTFTEIIRDVKVVLAGGQSVVTPQTNTVFHAPDRVRTGVASRVEMTAPDKTITRIGANTVFTFEDGGRSMALEKGSILFHSPAGVGGGTIRYRGTSAAVLGTTMVCAVLPDGSFKILDLEGKVKVTLINGACLILESGQMVVVLPDGNEFRKMEVFNIGRVIARLVLVVGFSEPLSSLPLILEAMQEQNRGIADGTITLFTAFNPAVFGLEIVYRDLDPSLPRFQEWRDHTMDFVSPIHPGEGWDPNDYN